MINFTDIDEGNCRVYFKGEHGGIFCYQVNNEQDIPFSFYSCSHYQDYREPEEILEIGIKAKAKILSELETIFMKSSMVEELIQFLKQEINSENSKDGEDSSNPSTA